MKKCKRKRKAVLRVEHVGGKTELVVRACDGIKYELTNVTSWRHKEFSPLLGTRIAEIEIRASHPMKEKK